MDLKKLLLLILFCIVLVSTATAEIKQVQMRVEGMT